MYHHNPAPPPSATTSQDYTGNQPPAAVYQQIHPSNPQQCSSSFAGNYLDAGSFSYHGFFSPQNLQKNFFVPPPPPPPPNPCLHNPSMSNQTSDNGYQEAQDYCEDYYDDSYEDGNGYFHGRREEKLERRSAVYFCEICNVECTGEQAYQAHLDGKAHTRKAANTEGASSQFTSQRNKAAYHCEVCNADCSGADVFQAHVNGQKHQKAIKVLMKANKPIPSSEITLVMPTVPSEGMEEPPGKKTKPSKMQSDNPNLIPLGLGSTLQPDLANERLLMAKLDQIGLNEAQNLVVERLVLLVEETLYSVSGLIESSRAAPPEQSQNSRLLRGIMRVGLLANRLLLKSDTRADLVVLCSTIPTFDLLFQVTQLFRDSIKADRPVVVTDLPQESGFTVSRQGMPISVYVTLTNSAMRQWSPGDLNYYAYPEPPNGLPKVPCLFALAEMRRAKFYQVKCEPHPSIGCLVKLVRDFGLRVPAWSRLSNWMVILLVHTALSLQTEALGPSAALKTLFTSISEGLVLGEGTQLLDPCEKLPTDATASLSSAERKGIFASARYALRQINTNKLAKLLALEGPGIPTQQAFPLGGRKRPRSGSPGGIGQVVGGNGGFHEDHYVANLGTATQQPQQGPI